MEYSENSEFSRHRDEDVFILLKIDYFIVKNEMCDII